MQVVDDAGAVPPIVDEFNALLKQYGHGMTASLPRYDFYARAAKAYVVVATGEKRIYGNILLKKGVISA